MFILLTNCACWICLVGLPVLANWRQIKFEALLLKIFRLNKYWLIKWLFWWKSFASKLVSCTDTFMRSQQRVVISSPYRVKPTQIIFNGLCLNCWKSEVIQSLISVIAAIYTPVEYVTKYFFKMRNDKPFSKGLIFQLSLV